MAYQAFISYSHSADGRLAEILQRSLHRFAKPWWKIRALNIFRDETDLAANSSLTGVIQAALTGSEYFIFLASPRSAASKWCRLEIARWLETHQPDHFLIVLTEGAITWDDIANDFDWQRSDALPPDLAGRFTNEPFWLDLSWVRGHDGLSAREPRFQQVVAKLAATLHGRSLSEISGEDVRQHRLTQRLARAAVGAIALFAIAAAAGGVYAWRQSELAAEQRNIAVEQSKLAAEQRNIAVQQRQAAEAARTQEQLQRKQAEANLDAALKTVDVLLDDVVGGMRTVGLPKDKARALLDKVSRSLDALEGGGGDGKVAKQRVQMYAAMADNYLHLGEVESAARHGESARRLTQALVDASPNDGDLQGDLAGTHVVLGEVKLIQGDLPGALRNLHEALAILERDIVVKAHSASWIRGAKSMAWARIGMAHHTMGDSIAAIDGYERSLAMVDAVADSSLSERDSLSVLTTEVKLAEALAGRGQFARAVEVARSLLGRARARGPRIAANLEWQYRVAAAQIYLAVGLVGVGDLENALVANREATAIFERLLDRDADNTMWRLDMALNYLYMSEPLKRLGRLDDAAQSLRSSIDNYQAILARDKANQLARSNLALGHVMLGELLRRRDDVAGAIKAFEAAAAAAKEVRDQSPTFQRVAFAIAGSMMNLGELAAARGDHEAAASHYAEGADLLDRASARDTAHTLVAEMAGRARRQLGQSLSRLKRHDAALKAFLASRDIRARLAQAGGERPLRDLWYVQEEVAGELSALGRVDEAREAQQAAVDTGERALAVNNGAGVSRYSLFDSHRYFAQLLEAPTGALSRSLKHWKRACELAAETLAAGGLSQGQLANVEACAPALAAVERRIAQGER